MARNLTHIYGGRRVITTELSQMEFRVLRELCRAGGTNKEIAAALDSDEEKIRGYLRIAFVKMRVTTRGEAILKAIRTGMVSIDGP